MAVIIFITILFYLTRFLHYSVGLNPPYTYADYYWTLGKEKSAHEVVDKLSQMKGVVYGAKFIRNVRIGGAVSFSGRKEWIGFPSGQFNSDCIANPDFCDLGLTIAFWIRFKEGKNILSTGAFTNSSQGTGVQITYVRKTKEYKVQVRTTAAFWEARTTAYNNTWCHISLVWSVTNGLNLCLDGRLVSRDVFGSQDIIQSPSYSQMLTIARPPKLAASNDFGNFDMSHLGIWLFELSHNIASQAGKLVFPTSALDDAGYAMCIRKKNACKRMPCGSRCHFGFPNAVCIDISHTTCKEITREKPPLASTPTTIWSQTPTSVSQITKEVTYFTSTVGSKAATDHVKSITSISSILPTIKSFPDDSIDSLYKSAVHYIYVKDNRLLDARAKGQVSFIPVDKRRDMLLSSQLGKVARLDGRDDYIKLFHLKSKCIHNPIICKDNGFTVAFWVRINNSKKQYIAYSSHGEGYKGDTSVPGFMIYHGINSTNFTIEVATKTEVWKLVLHRVPFMNEWWHLSFTWTKSSGISLYINGQFAVQSPHAEKRMSKRLSDEIGRNGELIIGQSKNSHDFISAINMIGHFDIGHIAIWDRAFGTLEIERAFKVTITETDKSKKCCKTKSGHDCIALPCHKFEDANRCDKIIGSHDCICKDILKPRTKCKIETPMDRCLDKETLDCKQLAAQTGYCNFFQVEMETFCPASCKFCASTYDNSHNKPKTTFVKEQKKTKPEEMHGLYRNAAHYFKVEQNSLVDILATSKKTIFPSTLKIKDTEQIGKVVSLNGIDYSLSIKGFQRECITDPNVCTNGLSVAFWLRMFKGKYIISGGQYRDEPRGSGFKIFHDANSSQLRVEIATAKKKWKAILHKIPSTGRWFHLIFTWSQGTGLQISINGQFLLSSDRPIERKYSLKSSYEQNGIFIGGKDSSDERTQHVQYDIGHLAFWNYVLDVREIQHAYRYTIIKNAISQMCCIKLSANKCVANACYKFRAKDSCDTFFRSNQCLCQDPKVLEKCKEDVVQGECKDKRQDCKELAIQPGYCDFYQQDMANLCPASCNLCGKNTSEPIVGKKQKSDNETKKTREINIMKQDIEKYANKSDTENLEFDKQNMSNREWPIKEDNRRMKGKKNVSMSSATEFKFAGSRAVKVTNDKPQRTDLRKNNTAAKYEKSHQYKERPGKVLSKEVLIFSLIGCAAGIILLFLISLYSWKVYRSKFTGAFIPSFKASSLLEVDEYGDERWTKKYIDSSYFVIKDVPPKKRALPVIPAKPAQPKYQPPDFQ